jgi:hypothetical protein
MKRIYKTALGKAVDIDQLRLSNEDVIAVGNMKVNARGDELGPGGEVMRSRNEVMNEYYKLNTPTVESTPVTVVDDEALYRTPEPQRATPGVLRGSLADSVLKSEDE